jgi:excinuclease ABC subunit C
MTWRRIFLSQDERDILNQVLHLDIHLRNNFGSNKEAIDTLLSQAKDNAEIYLERHKLGQNLTLLEENSLFTCLVELRDKLGLYKIPRRIECYDISHLSGTFVYGSMVVFKDGRASKKDYRLFRVKDKNDDFANHREVLTRRFQKALQEKLEERQFSKQQTTETGHLSQPTANPKFGKWTLPDLIIVDGGKGQLSSDLDVLEQYKQIFAQNNLDFVVEICALAKREEEVFSPGKHTPVIFTGQTLFLIQRIRDEAHRLAITNNRKARLRSIQDDDLIKIPGVGIKTRQKLLQKFQSLENLINHIHSHPELVIEAVGKSIYEKLKKQFGM